MEEAPDLRDGNGTDTGRESRDRNRKQRQKRKNEIETESRDGNGTDTGTEEKYAKKELALQVIERLKRSIRTRDVRWIMTMHGSFWSV